MYYLFNQWIILIDPSIKNDVINKIISKEKGKMFDIPMFEKFNVFFKEFKKIEIFYNWLLVA